MSVTERDLSNPERGQAPLRKPEDGQAPLDKRGPGDERARAEAESARAVKKRVAAARELNPTPEELHWRERWNKGRDEACRVFEETEGTLQERVNAARVIEGQAGDGCRDCFDHGRDAALRVILGTPEGRPR